MEVTYGLMIVIGLVTYIAWLRPALHNRLMLNSATAFHQKQYYRLLTSGFVHNNSTHLFLNLLTLYFFGLAIDEVFIEEFGKLGSVLYVLFFLTAIVVANVPTMIKYKDNPNYNSLGASGGVSALVLAFVLFDPLKDLCLYNFFCLPGYVLGLVFILYSIVMSIRNADNINHNAHLFGALYGALFTLILRPQVLSTFYEAIFH